MKRRLIRKEVEQARELINQAILVADEMREDNRAYRETLQAMFDDVEIPLEIRQQYERLLVQQLMTGGVF